MKEVANWFRNRGPFFYTLLLIFLGGLALVSVALVYAAYFGEISRDHTAWGEFGSFYGGIAGTIIAALALAALAVTAKLQMQQIALDRQRHDAEMRVNELDENYRRAYEALFDPTGDGLPRNSRLAWLSAARLILIAERVSESVPDDYLWLSESKELFWRFMFFDLLDPLETVGEGYWAESVERLRGWTPGERAPISERSAKVIHDWVYSGFADPMEGQPRFSEEEIDTLRTFRWRSLGNLLKKYQERIQGGQ